MQIAKLDRVAAFSTLDGSTIRELAGPARATARNQSLAEATVVPAGETKEHYHRQAEEIYWFRAGAGRMRLGDEEAAVRAGDCVVIPPAPRTSSGTRATTRWCSCAAARPRTPMRTPC